MGVILQPDSSEPLYKQVRHAIEQAIVNGQFEQCPLPSSRALALELGISRNTVNLAYQEMLSEGLIVSQERVGYRANTAVIMPSGRIDSNIGASASNTMDWNRYLRPRVPIDVPEITKDYDWQRYPYPFIYGQVPSSSFPITAWNRALRTSMEYPHVHWSLRDGGSDDDPLLVEQLRTNVLASRGIWAAPEEILITLGAQNGLFLAARALLGSGDSVTVENPGYPDVAHILAGTGARVVPVDVDLDGLRIDDIPPNTKLISVTPSHQFPTNVGLSPERRELLLKTAHRNNALILEDDYDTELRYIGRAAPALRASDPERVIYVGSFSKFLAPGLRIGYVVAAPELIERMREERRYSVRHPPGQIQRALALMIESGDYQRVLRKYRLALRDKWEAMNTALKFIIGRSYQPSTGGTSMWVPLPEDISAEAVRLEAAKRGVLVESGAPCFTNRHPDQHRFLRVGYAAIPIESILPGLRVLADVIHDQRKKMKH